MEYLYTSSHFDLINYYFSKLHIFKYVILSFFRESMIYAELEQKAVYNEDEKYVLFGDQGYGIMELVINPFPGRPNLEPEQQLFNQSMKVLRICVEWGFQKIISLFAFIDFKKNQKIYLQDVGSMYKVAVLLTNCHTCLYGSQTSAYFNTVPPTLNEYLELAIL